MSWTLKRHGPWLSTVILAWHCWQPAPFSWLKAWPQGMKSDRVDCRADFHQPRCQHPGVLVDDPHTARAQADAIKNHTLGTWALTVSWRGTTPEEHLFDGVALRSALNQAVIGLD